MKTTLVLDDFIVNRAQHYARQRSMTLSQVISEWCRLGWEGIRQKNKAEHKRSFKPLNLGGSARVDLNNRQLWMDQLDDRA